jgi:hypothetical protein
MYDRSKPGPPRAVGRRWAGLIWLALAAASADRHTRCGLRRARHARHGKWPAEHMHISIFASVHVTPIATNHALVLAMTWPSGIPLRARVPRTWRSKFAKGVGCGSSGHIVTAGQPAPPRAGPPPAPRSGRQQNKCRTPALERAQRTRCGQAHITNLASHIQRKPRRRRAKRSLPCPGSDRRARPTGASNF